MHLDCASCDRYACRVGRLDATPDECPMRGPFPSYEELYATDDARRLLYHSARVEADGYGRWTRIQEVAELSRRLGYQSLGVAHCPDMEREAHLAARMLRSEGLRVVVPASGTDCDPVGQAAFLAEEGTQLNVLAGMCVGHDALFIRHSRALVTSLVVRDRRLAHNPVAALYTRESYLKTALYGAKEPPAAGRFAGWSDELLDRIAREVRDEGLRRETPPCRVEEVMAFARRAGVTHLGVVFCVGFRREAQDLEAILGTNGFRVSSSCCKTGSVPKEDLGIKDEEKVRPGQPEMTCNPAAQAELLEEAGVDLVLLLGQCVGHDSATMARLRTPVVCLVAKDRVLAHNTVAALYRAQNGREADPTMSEGHMVRALGHVRSTLRNPADAPRMGSEGAPDAWLDLDPDLLPAMLGLEAGKEIIVVTWLHLAARDVLEVHPRGDLERPLRGVFSTRSPSRPNPLGLHRVTVREVSGARLRVGPIEAVDGTPVVDLKPVLKGGADG